MRTTYRIEKTQAHETIRVWVNGALSSALTVRLDERELLEWIERALVERGATRST